MSSNTYIAKINQLTTSTTNQVSSNCNQALEKYKKYKNKLTKILRSCEKHYFDKILKEQSNNIRGTWKILNSIIGKNKTNEISEDQVTEFT